MPQLLGIVPAIDHSTFQWLGNTGATLLIMLAWPYEIGFIEIGCRDAAYRFGKSTFSRFLEKTKVDRYLVREQAVPPCQGFHFNISIFHSFIVS